MEEKMNKLMDLLIAGLEKGSELLNNEVPELLKEVVVLKTIESSTWLVVSGLIFVTLLSLGFYCFKLSKKDSDFRDNSVFLIVISIVPFIIGVTKGIEVVQLQYAPKAYIMQDLLKYNRR